MFSTKTQSGVVLRTLNIEMFVDLVQELVTMFQKTQTLAVKHLHENSNNLSKNVKKHQCRDSIKVVIFKIIFVAQKYNKVNFELTVIDIN